MRYCSFSSSSYNGFPQFSFCKYTAYLRRRLIKSVHPCTLLMASFGCAETSLLLSTSGIRAATDNPQRIRTAKDGGGSNRNEICAMQISQVRNVHGSTFLTVPAVLFCLSPCICTVYLQKALFRADKDVYFLTCLRVISEAARMPLVLSSSDVLPNGKTRVFR